MPTNRLVEKEKVAVYANALFEAASSKGGRDAAIEIRDEVESLSAIIRGNANLSEALSDTMLAPAQRAQIAKNVFVDADGILVDVLAVMAERGDIKLFTRVAAAYEALVSEKFNVTIVDVTTVVELDDHLREVITNKAAKDFGTDVVLREHIDKSILGGVLLSAGGSRLNASVRWQLENARVALKN